MSSSHAKVAVGVSKDSSFLGGRIPSEIEIMAKQLKDLDQEMFRKILKAVVNAIEGKDCREAMKAIAENAALPEERLSYVVAGMYRLLKEALRIPTSSLKQEVFKEDLRELKRTTLEAVTMQQGPRLPSLKDFRWRVDVAISTSSLARALQPSILMQMKLSDGKAHRFEVPVSKFQELRYNVALILKEMNDLEKRSVLKIQD
ncbi:COMM domain-containing protein 5 isoform X2 [Coregonus clupeaformis]|uniref:COMM domain-containing protein 5 isoform X2 n=1 Tax=Coregonus clupeaformis TaxID=59861 RepID=UPI001E1C63C0|nr:COMM domain-containing protein 5 isoform X2 [Coregonus clupeaformis]